MAKIFITGSSDGLGLLTAKALVSTGHYVVLHARNEERAKSTERQLPEAEKVLIADLSSMEETLKSVFTSSLIFQKSPSRAGRNFVSSIQQKT